MKRNTLASLVTALLLGITTQVASEECFSDCLCNSVLNIEVDCGWRQDQMNFALNLEQEDGSIDNTDFKLTAIDSIQTGARILWTFPCDLYLRARGDYGHVYNATEKTTTMSDANEPFSFLPKFKDGCVYDLLGGIGYQFHVFCDQIIIAPVVGWSANLITLNTHKGKLQGVFPGGPTEVQLTEQHIHGRAQGPWIGLDMMCCPIACMTVYGNVEYHWDDYHQEETEVIDATIEVYDLLYHQASKTTRKANCWAFETTLGADYAVWDCLSLGIVGHYKYMSGTMRHSIRFQESFGKDPEGNIILPLTEVGIPTKKSKIHWQTADVEVALIYRF